MKIIKKSAISNQEALEYLQQDKSDLSGKKSEQWCEYITQTCDED